VSLGVPVDVQLEADLVADRQARRQLAGAEVEGHAHRFHADLLAADAAQRRHRLVVDP
jgi:hypothetical protein